MMVIVSSLICFLHRSWFFCASLYLFFRQVISSRGDLWGLFQPYAHLSSSRIASGTLVLSPCLSALPDTKSHSYDRRGGNKERSVGQILLTTCVGSTEELEEMALIAATVCHKAWQASSTFSSSSSSPPPPSTSTSTSASAASLSSGGHSAPPRWSPASISALYHFMRCSQLEYVGQAEGRTPIQELVYERPYLVLPPVVEWVRCAHAFAAHRGHDTIDQDDVAQAARWEKMTNANNQASHYRMSKIRAKH